MGTKLRLASGILIATTAVAGCDAPSYPAYDRAQMLGEASEMLIIPAYTDAAARAVDLDTATGALCASPTATTLDAAQAAWLDAAIAWHRTSPYLITAGPVVAGNIDAVQGGDITFPASPTVIEANVTSGADFTSPSYVDGLGGPAKGFYAIEYLLFAYPGFTTDGDDAMTLAALGDAHRCAYLSTLTAHLVARTAAARDGWDGADGFGAILSSSTGTSTYTNPQGAAEAYISAIANAVDRVRDHRLGRPLGLVMNTGDVESQYAHASIALLEATIDEIHDAWTMTPHSLDTFLRTRDTRLADQVVSEIEGAQASIHALESPPLAMTFEHYVTGTDHTAGQAAYQQVQTLEASLTGDVSAKLTLNVTILADGD